MQAWLSASTVASLSHYGTITERVTSPLSIAAKASLTPVPDAGVGLGGDMGPLAATTITDTDGRHVICGVPSGQDELWVNATGYQLATRGIDVGGDTTLDIEMRR